MTTRCQPQALQELARLCGMPTAYYEAALRAPALGARLAALVEPVGGFMGAGSGY